MGNLKSVFAVNDKVAIVTGGSGTIGSEMARGLLGAGAKVVLIARNEERLRQKAEALGGRR